MIYVEPEKKQYCAENRKKYERPMTDKEKRCVIALVAATWDSLRSMSVWNALVKFGLAIATCIV